MRPADGLLHFADSQDGIYRMQVGLDICLKQFCPQPWRIGQREHSLRCRVVQYCLQTHAVLFP